MSDLDRYGELRSGHGTDIQYRVRDDGDFVQLFDPSGDPLDLGLRKEDIAAMADDLDL